MHTGNGFTYNGDPNAWRLKKALAGGGGLMDMGIYSIQGTRYTLGQEPIAVKATQEKTKPDLFKEVDETVFWELEFPGGFKTTGKSSYNHDWSYLKVEEEHGKFELGPAYGYGGIDGSIIQCLFADHDTHKILIADAIRANGLSFWKQAVAGNSAIW